MKATNPIRSALFVPAMRPDRIKKAMASGADAIIADLEDSIAPEDKGRAREFLLEFIKKNKNARICVRINPIESPEHEKDLALCRHEAVSHIVLPKSLPDKGFENISELGKPIWPIIESAAAIVKLPELVVIKNVDRLLLGNLDLMTDLNLMSDLAPAERVLEHARFKLILHSRVGDIAAPIDGVYPALNDEKGLRTSAFNARAMGYGGKICIHPKQVAIVNKAFSPTQAELKWAKSVLWSAENADSSVFVLDGKMIDAPVLNMAHRIMNREIKD